MKQWWDQPRNWWLPAMIALLGLGLSALFPTEWYDDVCHRLTMHTLVQHGHSGFPTELALTQDQAPRVVAFRAESQFVTVGPAVHYPVTGFGLTTKLGRWPMVGFALAMLGLLLVLTNRIAAPGRAFWAAMLVAGSIQYVTYGSQYLGEVPLLAYTLAAFLGLEGLLSVRARPFIWGLLLVGGTVGAILSKAYIGLPLGLVWLGIWIWAIRHRKWVMAIWFTVAGLLLPTALVLNLAVRLGDWAAVGDYLSASGAYRNEFLALTFTESLKFLALKPVILFGTLALFVRAVFYRKAIWAALAGFQAVLLVLFLLSAGFDRFGLLLLPLAALAGADWVIFALRRVSPAWDRPRKWRIAAVIVLVLALAWQKTPWEVPRRAAVSAQLNYGFRLIKGAPRYLLSHRRCSAGTFTYDLAHIPELIRLPGDEMIRLNLPQNPPCAAAQDPGVPPGLCLIGGEYADTEYHSWKIQGFVPDSGISQIGLLLWVRH